MVISTRPDFRATRETKTPEPTRRALVLLVEDDDEMRKMLAFLLTRHGFRVTQARDGSEALAYLGDVVLGGSRDKAPQLLLTDQRMPGFCGLDVIEAARLAGLKIPAILITAFGDTETHERADALGATPVLDKPFAMLELVALARRLAPGESYDG
ncbi:MAG TPA: response regulator [Myxococcota bacterium]|nr:response regulator [Myxococcota bacterium]